MKNTSHLLLWLGLIFVTFQGYVRADWYQIPADGYSMNPPPEEGSAAYKRDFKLLIQYQEQDREAACELARGQVAPTYESMFLESSPLSASEYSKAKTLVARAMKYSGKIAGVFKEEYMRPRPYDVDERIKPCARKPGGAKAYPSSHAAAASVGSCVLAELYPGKKAALLAYGKHLGDIRAVVGVHHPSDVHAGQELGEAICVRLLGDNEFSQELEASK